MDSLTVQDWDNAVEDPYLMPEEEFGELPEACRSGCTCLHLAKRCLSLCM